MDAELAPFLRGEVLIFDMRLVHPKGVIDIAADGTVDWTMRPSSPFDASQISIENMTISDGEIELRQAAQIGHRGFQLAQNVGVFFFPVRQARQRGFLFIGFGQDAFGQIGLRRVKLGHNAINRFGLPEACA